MKTTRRALAVLLSFVTALGAVPHEAAAQVIVGGAVSGGFGASRAGGVPRVELSGQSLTPLSPAFSFAPMLGGGLVPTLSAPTPALSAPAAAFSFAPIPVLPVSALAAVPLAVPFARTLQAARPVDAGKLPLRAGGQLALAGEHLSAAAAKGSDKGVILEALFTGANRSAAQSDGSPVAGAVPTALTPNTLATAREGKATPPTPIKLDVMAIDSVKKADAPPLDLASVKKTLITLAIGAAIPLLIAHAPLAGTIGSLMLMLHSLPQIIKNFKIGKEATKDLALKTVLLWHGASVFLTVNTILNNSYWTFLASSLFGTLVSGLVLAQINFHRRDPAVVKTTLKTVSAYAAIAAVALLHPFFAPAVWGVAAFSLGISLVLLINWPQIRRNFDLYSKEGRAPTIVWQTNALVMAANLINLIPAIARPGHPGAGPDWLWVATSLIGLLNNSMVLGQVFLPKQVNSFLDKRVFAPLGKLKKAIGRVFSRGSGNDVAMISSSAALTA